MEMRENLNTALSEIQKAVVGKESVLRKVLMTILADGHILLDDVPGVGKTTLAMALSRALGLSCRRVQFTPDVLPSDIVGFSIYDRQSGEFIYRPGILNNTNLLLGDEINRTSSKTQSALLEAMEEKQITVDGNAYPLPKPFIVIATQNNVGTAGTQFLPYAQVDRFMVRLSIGYPDHQAQMEMIRDRQTGDPLEQVQCVLSKEVILAMQQDVRRVTVKDSIVDYISRLAIATRNHELIELGISPRGAIFINRMANACAWMDGRDYVIPSDVQHIFSDVCGHRIILNRKASAEGKNAAQVLADVLNTVSVPGHGDAR